MLRGEPEAVGTPSPTSEPAAAPASGEEDRGQDGAIASPEREQVGATTGRTREPTAAEPRPAAPRPLRARAQVGRWTRRGLGVGISLALAVLAQRHLVPAPFELGDDGGTWAAWVRAVDGQPVATLLAFFLLFLALYHYWEPRWSRGAARNELAVSARAASLPPRSRVRRAPWLAATLRYAGWTTLALGAAWLVRARLFETDTVVSTSMLPTLNVGDQLLVNKIAYGGLFSRRRLPSRGDNVVFFTKGLRMWGTTGDDVHQLVKRVIGLPGDEIAMRQNHPIINGWAVPFCELGDHTVVTAAGTYQGRLSVEWLAGHAYLVLTGDREHFSARYRVGPDEVFVLGDQRRNSSDSRTWNQLQGGGVPLAAIVGRVDRILLGRNRAAHVDWLRWLSPLELGMAAENADTRLLRAMLEGCLAHPPDSRVPPAPSISPPIATAEVPSAATPRDPAEVAESALTTLAP